MISFLSDNSVKLYALIKDSDYAKLSKKENPSEQIVFYEYPIRKKEKDYCNIVAEVSIERMLDMLKPNSQAEIYSFEKERYRNNNMIFKDENELVHAYAKIHKNNLIRTCKVSNSYIRTNYAIIYRVLDISCIKRIEIMK